MAKSKPKLIDLGKLPPFEYEMLRAAIRWGRIWCEASADRLAGSVDIYERTEEHNWRDRASEVRAIEARFLKRGRR